MSQGILNRLKHGPENARNLTGLLGISQPTVSRRLSALIKKGQVIQIGKARASRYVAVRKIAGIASFTEIPIYEIDAKGVAKQKSNSLPLFPASMWIEKEVLTLPADFQEDRAYYESLPFYLESMRPEGFLGRNLCKQISKTSELPDDARRWDEDQLLYFLYYYGFDQPGSIIYGKASLERALRNQVEPISEDRIDLEYDRLANAALAGDPIGSSAGGEQPKFTACIQRRIDNRPIHVIVKFSSAKNTPEALRWRDLIVSEYHALKLLKEKGYHATPVDLLQINGRMMLQLERHDRVGLTGRRPWVSIGAIDDEFFGYRDNIRAAMTRMVQAKLIPASEAQEGATISLFGDFIGNTDQHFGNYSFTWDDSGLQLGPFYDVLPMFYAPRELAENVTLQTHALPVCMPDEEKEYTKAWKLAKIYWNNILAEKLISDDFKGIARAVLEKTIMLPR